MEVLLLYLKSPKGIEARKRNCNTIKIVSHKPKPVFTISTAALQH